MAIATIGTPRIIGASGRLGVVVAVQALGPPQDGRQLVALSIRTAAGPGTPGQPGAELPGSGAVPATGDNRVAAGQVPGGVRPAERLSPAEKAELAALQRRDAQVRQEENAHADAAGKLGGPISYVYQRGPDGRMYAVGGSVPIRAQVADDPEEAARLGRRIAGAAFAAILPSSADYAAAAAAYQRSAGAARTESGRGASLDRAA